MHISQIKQSKFLTRADVGRGILVTIKEIFQENVAKDGAPEELKFCISFHEQEKPMVLNNTNAMIIAAILKSEETDTWIGQRIVLYDDPNVTFGDKLVGGIRCRAPRPATANPAPAPTHGPLGKPTHRPAPAAPTPAPEPPPGESDDVPF